MFKNRVGCVRIGITAGKKVGNAVFRNRSRRIIREGLRSVLRNGFPGLCGVDIVFVARSRTPQLKSNDVEKIILKSFSALRVAETFTDSKQRDFTKAEKT